MLSVSQNYAGSPTASTVLLQPRLSSGKLTLIDLDGLGGNLDMYDTGENTWSHTLQMATVAQKLAASALCLLSRSMEETLS
jgi:hypothetical protein